MRIQMRVQDEQMNRQTEGEGGREEETLMTNSGTQLVWDGWREDRSSRERGRRKGGERKERRKGGERKEGWREEGR